jgi:hypothetical protein
MILSCVTSWVFLLREQPKRLHGESLKSRMMILLFIFHSLHDRQFRKYIPNKEGKVLFYMLSLFIAVRWYACCLGEKVEEKKHILNNARWCAAYSVNTPRGYLHI